MLAVLTTHPIQYQVPVWKALAARGNLPFKVFFMSNQGLEAQFDPGFGIPLAWDIDLLSGYQSEFLDTYSGKRSDSFWRWRLKRGFGAALRQMGTKVLWIQGWQVAAYWQAVFEARRAGIQVWLRGETNSRSGGGGIGRHFKRLLLYELLQRVDRFLCIGEPNRQYYRRLGIEDERLASAPYCVDNRRFAAAAAAARPDRQHIRESWGIPTDAFCFLFAGKFVTTKRPFDLIEATRRLERTFQGKQVHLLWVGTGELGGELRKACNLLYDGGMSALVNTPRPNGPNASFVGFLNQSEISRAYVAADCLVLPSDAKETWGLVVNEAMASGLPCIVSDACGCAEDLVEPIRPDLCYPVGAISALERAMVAAISQPLPHELLSAHISKYDVARTINTVENLYFQGVKRMVTQSDRPAA